jgi:hypothetical protein
VVGTKYFTTKSPPPDPHFASISSQFHRMTPQAGNMHFTTFATSLLACSSFAPANHHAGLAQSIAKRQKYGQLEAVFSGDGGVSGSIIVSEAMNSSAVVYAVQMQLPSVGGPFGG